MPISNCYLPSKALTTVKDSTELLNIETLVITRVEPTGWLYNTRRELDLDNVNNSY